MTFHSKHRFSALPGTMNMKGLSSLLSASLPSSYLLVKGNYCVEGKAHYYIWEISDFPSKFWELILPLRLFPPTLTNIKRSTFSDCFILMNLIFKKKVYLYIYIYTYKISVFIYIFILAGFLLISVSSLGFFFFYIYIKNINSICYTCYTFSFVI